MINQRRRPESAGDFPELISSCPPPVAMVIARWAAEPGRRPVPRLASQRPHSMARAAAAGRPLRPPWVEVATMSRSFLHPCRRGLAGLLLVSMDAGGFIGPWADGVGRRC